MESGLRLSTARRPSLVQALDVVDGRLELLNKRCPAVLASLGRVWLYDSYRTRTKAQMQREMRQQVRQRVL